MPLYDFQCRLCTHEFEHMSTVDQRKEVRCPKCNGMTKILITSARSKHWFKPYWDDGFTGEPIFVRSLNHMKELCIKHDVTSRAIGDCRNYTHKYYKPEGVHNG